MCDCVLYVFSCKTLWNTTKTIFIDPDVVNETFKAPQLVLLMESFKTTYNLMVQIFYNLVITYKPQIDP